MIVGTSVGSLIGALYAADPSSLNLEWLAFSIEKEDIFDYSVVYSKMGPVLGDRLEKFVQTKAKVKNLEQMKIPFFPVATDLNTGQTWVFEKGFGGQGRSGQFGHSRNFPAGGDQRPDLCGRGGYGQPAGGYRPGQGGGYHHRR